MNWQSLVIIGIIVILFIILMIINASTADLDQDNTEEDLCCLDAVEPMTSDVGEDGQLSSLSNKTAS